jgi:hypothetical protein
VDGVRCVIDSAASGSASCSRDATVDLSKADSLSLG